MAKKKVRFLRNVLMRNKAVGLEGSRSMFAIGAEPELDEDVIAYLEQNNPEGTLEVLGGAEPEKRGPGRPKKSE